MPTVEKWSGRVACGHRTFSRSLTLGQNPTLIPRSFSVAVQVRNARTLHGVWRRIKVTQQAPSASIDHYSAVTAGWGTYGNVSFFGAGDGDCAVATAGDLLQSWAAQDGKASAPLEPAYFSYAYQTMLGGPGGPDEGLAPETVLNYWQNTGIDGNKIKGWSKLPATDQASVENGVTRYGALYAEFWIPVGDAPQAAYLLHPAPWTMSEAPAGSATDGTHAAALVGYDSYGPYFSTWGDVQHVSWDWWNTWGIATYGISHDASWTPNPQPTITNYPSVSLYLARSITNSSGSGSVNQLLVEVVGGTSTADRVTVYSDGQPVNGCAPLATTTAPKVGLGNGQSTTAIQGTCTINWSFGPHLFYATSSSDPVIPDTMSVLWDAWSS